MVNLRTGRVHRAGRIAWNILERSLGNNRSQ
jgi:hypothetical protein